MAAKTLTEAIHVALLCIGPLNQVEQRMRGEIRDFLAHEVARFVKKNDAMKDYDVLAKFVTEVLKDIPANGGGK